ncbi:MAG: hypothetical protein EOM64_00830 [Erysipelotrichia bacterium]|nr:hypothetical protein [Erysipelotrichia bacterium]
MDDRTWKITWVIAALGLLSGFISWRFATGYALGAAVAVLLYKRNEGYWNEVVDMGNARKGTGFTHFLVNYGLMAGALILCAKMPQYFNIFACAIGQMLIKISVMAGELIQGKEHRS